MPVKLIAILVGIGLVLLIGAMFFFAGQADSRRPAQTEIRVPAENIGPNAAAPAGGGNVPPQ